MKATLALTANFVVIVFAVSSMTSVGLSYDIRTIVRPLRRVRAVFDSGVQQGVIARPAGASAIRAAGRNIVLKGELRDRHLFVKILVELRATISSQRASAKGNAL